MDLILCGPQSFDPAPLLRSVCCVDYHDIPGNTDELVFVWTWNGPVPFLYHQDFRGFTDELLSRCFTGRWFLIAGKLLRVETLHAVQDSVTAACVSKPSLDSNRKYFSFLRLLYLEVEGMAPIKAKISE